MRLRVLKRSLLIYNAIIFVLVSPIFLYVMDSLLQGATIFAVDHLKSYFFVYQWLFAATLPVAVSIFYLWRMSRLFLLVYVFICLFFALSMFISSFDKVLLFLSAFYFIIGFYFYIFLGEEMKEAAFNPGYNTHTIGKKNIYPLNVIVLDRYNQNIGAMLTNWDEGSLFLITNEKYRIRGYVKVILEFSGEYFEALGQIVACYGKDGYGVKIKESSLQVKASMRKDGNKNHFLSWNDYYDIISSRGYEAAIT